MKQQRLTPEWKTFRDKFEQCGYTATPWFDKTDHVCGWIIRDSGGQKLRIEKTCKDSGWIVSERKDVGWRNTCFHVYPKEVRAAALRWLGAQHGTLDFTQRPNRLTEAQRRTFSREWNQLFDELAERGYKIEWKGSSVWISAGAAETKDFVYIELHHAGGWELRMYAPRSCEIRWDSCEGVRTAIRDWIHIVTGKAASA